MRKWVIFISAFLLIAGCPSQDTEAPRQSHYDKVSQEIERLKAESLDTTLTEGNIGIVINMLSVSSNEYSAVDSLWRYTDQNIHIVKRPETFRRSGLKIGIAGKEFKGRLDIIKKQLTSSEETELFIVVSEGYPGYISIGREIAVPRFYYLGRWYSRVDYQFVQAGKSLKVLARKLANGWVEMELTPVFSKFLSNGGDIELTELSTRVVALPGQSVILGQVDTAEENVATALFSSGKGAKKKHTLIVVTARVN